MRIGDEISAKRVKWKVHMVSLVSGKGQVV